MLEVLMTDAGENGIRSVSRSRLTPKAPFEPCQAVLFTLNAGQKSGQNIFEKLK